MTVDTWQKVAADKVAAREALIPAEWRITVPKGLNVTDVPRTCGLLSASELEITETPAVDLLAKLASGELTSVQVTTAFCKRSAIAQQLTNCLTEIMYEDGLKRAAAIDAEFAKTGKTIGPLHGLPISLKDNVNIAGLDSTTGFINYANKPATEDADLVTTIKEAGAVIFCKTNVPTGMVSSEPLESHLGAYN
jgi:amidase